VRSRLALPLVALLLIATPSLAQTAPDVPEIGVAASVVPRVSGEPPGRTLRSLQVGIDVLRNERIATGPAGRAQMLFRDGSALTVGPDSEVVLDEYVYDPASGAGRMAASLSKGVLRYVGGQISKREPVTLKTPSATIGIRGGVFLYDNGRVTFLFGEVLTVEGIGPDGAAQRVELRRPGSAMSIGADGRLGPPGPAPSSEVGPTLARLEGQSGDSGGAPVVPTDPVVAATQVALLGSANTPTAIGPIVQAAAQDSLLAPARAESVTDLAQAAQVEAVSEQTADFTGAVFTAVGLRRPVFSSFSSVSSSFAIAPKDPNTFDRSGTGFAGNNILQVTFGDGDSAMLPFLSGFFSASASTPSGMLSGTGFVSPARDFFFYSLIETANGNPALLFGGVPIQGFTTPAALTFLSHRLVSAFPDSALIPTLPAALNGNLPGALVSPFYSVLAPNLYAAGDSNSQFLWAALAIQGQGAGQRTAFIGTTGRYYVDQNSSNPTFGKLVAAGAQRGFVRMGSNSVPGGDGELVRVEQGQTQLFDANGTGFFGSGDQTNFVLGSDNYNAATPFPLINTGGYGQRQSEVLLPPGVTFFSATPAIPQSLPAGIGATRTARTMNGYAAGIFDFGQYSGTTLTNITPLPSVIRGDNPFNLSITTDPSLNRLSATFRMRESAFNFDVNLEFGDLNFGNNVRSAFIDDDIFAARESEQRPNTFFTTPFNFNRNLLVTSAVTGAPTSILPAGVQYCECRYVKWGFFSADGNNNFILDLGTWVAGELPSLPSIPASGTATYTGHAIGSVSNNHQRYVAVGSYSQSWNFATRTGAATIGNFDGRTISGSVSSSNGREFSGSIAGGGVSGGLAGSFFQGGGDPVAEVGGQFAVSGSGYNAVGTVAGRR
jgi:trimeric autotransporter adhesin